MYNIRVEGPGSFSVVEIAAVWGLSRRLPARSTLPSDCHPQYVVVVPDKGTINDCVFS